MLSLVCFTGYCLPRSNVSYHAMTLPIYGSALVVAAFGHRAPALSHMIMVRLWLVHTVGALLLALLIYEHLGTVHLALSAQGQCDVPLFPVLAG